jgi:hypothetical protein
VETRLLTQAVKRNRLRFPSDFAFRLTWREVLSLQRSRSQSVILNRGANIKYPPLAFTEHGAIMAATVLNSRRAVQMSVFVVRAFLRMREWVAGRAELTARLVDLEGRVTGHDRDLKEIVITIRELIEARPPRRIGFRSGPSE